MKLAASIGVIVLVGIRPAQGKGSVEWQAVLEGLQEHGYVHGRNLIIECRWTEERDERPGARSGARESEGRPAPG